MTVPTKLPPGFWVIICAPATKLLLRTVMFEQVELWQDTMIPDEVWLEGDVGPCEPGRSKTVFSTRAPVNGCPEVLARKKSMMPQFTKDELRTVMFFASKTSRHSRWSWLPVRQVSWKMTLSIRMSCSSVGVSAAR